MYSTATANWASNIQEYKPTVHHLNIYLVFHSACVEVLLNINIKEKKNLQSRREQFFFC